MSGKFWATVFTVVSAVGALVLKVFGNLNDWALILIVALAGLAWILAIGREDLAKDRRSDEKRSLRVYRDGLPSNQNDRDRQRPSVVWIAA